jgi:hypothetical protein
VQATPTSAAAAGRQRAFRRTLTNSAQSDRIIIGGLSSSAIMAASTQRIFRRNAILPDDTWRPRELSPQELSPQELLP